jgi:hypothetical protein
MSRPAALAVLPRPRKKPRDVRTGREAVLIPRFNVKMQQMFAVDGTARGSGRACPLRVRGAGSECGAGEGGPRPRRGAPAGRRCRVRRPIAGFDPTSQPPEARHVTNMRKRGPAAGAARTRRARAGRPPRAVARPPGRRPRCGGIRAEPVQATLLRVTSVCHVCLCNLLRLLLSRRRARRGGASSRRLARGWGAGRGREPGAARD